MCIYRSTDKKLMLQTKLWENPGIKGRYSKRMHGASIDDGIAKGSVPHRLARYDIPFESSEELYLIIRSYIILSSQFRFIVKQAYTYIIQQVFTMYHAWSGF